MFVKEFECLQEYIQQQKMEHQKVQLKPLMDACAQKYVQQEKQITEDQIWQSLCNQLLPIYNVQDFDFTPTEVIKVALFSKNIEQAVSLQCFWEALEQSFYITSDLVNNKMCVALLLQILELVKDVQMFKHFKLFSDLFLSLDSYGTHITKEVWNKMDPFLLPPQFVVDSKLKEQLIHTVKPIEILIKKAAAHTNEKTIKNCIKALFKKDFDFTLIRGLIVDIIIPVLNKAVFYKDSPLEGDSKFFELLTKFLKQTPFLDDVVLSFSQHINYALAIGGFSVAFANVDHPISQGSLQIMVEYLKKHIGLLNLRKRIQLANAVVVLFKQNKEPKLLIELLKILPYECLKWRNESGTIGQLLSKQFNEEFRVEMMESIKTSEETNPQHIISSLDGSYNVQIFYQKIFLNLQQIYTSTYTDKESKHNNLKKLSNLLKYGVFFLEQNQIQIYQMLDNVASELFAYLQIDLDASLLIINDLWNFVLHRLIQDHNIAKCMSKYVGQLFQSWYEKQNQEIVIQLLNIILQQNNFAIFRAKLNKTGVFIEELFLKYGLEVLSQLQTMNMDRNLKNTYLHYLSNILTFHREVNHCTEQYFEQINQLIKNVQDISDQFNVYDYCTLYQLLQRVYSPEIAKHGLKHADELKSLAINTFENMMAIFGSQTNIDEMMAYLDFVIDPCYFENELCTVIQDIILILMKQSQKQWVLQRKIANNLVTCLYKHQDKMLIFKKVLMKLIKGSELRGYDTAEILPDQEQYVPMANKIKNKLTCKGEFYGAYPRFLVFGLLFEMSNNPQNHKDLILYVKYLIEQTTLVRYKNGYMRYTKHFRLKLHLWQNVCCLKKLFSPQHFFQAFSKEEGTILLQEFEGLIWKAFDQLNNPQYRQYMELMILYLMEYYPEIWGPRILKTLNDPKVQVNIQIPSVFISCVYILHQSDHPFANQLFKRVFPMVSSNVAYIRALCQTCCSQYIKKKQLTDFQEFIEYFQSNRECIKIIKNIETLIQRYENLLHSFDLNGLMTLQFDSFGEIIHPSIIDQLKETCISTISQIKIEDNMNENLPPSWHQYVDRNQQQQQQLQEEVPEFQFQRKINLILDQFEFFKVFKPRQMVGDLIVVASLLDKIPNIAHLTRTCEIFGCRELIIPSKKILQDEQYKAVSVSAEQHLPMSEVKEDFLMNYLLLKRMQGYQLVALEQTSQSKQIKDFKFAEKTVLILGREKTGLPIEYIELMDACVEIPQFGLVRSLNVHISAVICIWQYVQQFA